MNYTPEERSEVIRQAYRGLFELVAPMLFDKYVNFIDTYAGIEEDERDVLYREIAGQEDTAMLAQYIKEKGRQEGRQEGSYKTLSSMVKIMQKNGMSEEKIAKMMNMDIDTIKKILKGEQVDIPLDLL
jgi:predicted transposase/invertase (TIGR01784 family)